jgi:protein phosphatase
MLRIADHFQDSDLGRQRQGNEDNFFVRAPLFVVADGMGGAQAGEVASELAVREFEPGLPDGRDPAEALEAIIQSANRRIHETAREDTQRAGMGTTTTAAYVTPEVVVIAHVGDSRAYLFRDGDLIRLTRDHSLVEELVARGKLTEEQAEAHPQRSVITRALGPEPNVEVDLEAFPARDGDLFLLCSDGLTTMVPEQQLKPILERGGPLEPIGRELIAAANAAGGRDNITVILFRLEEVEGRRSASEGMATVEYDTFKGEMPTRQGTARPMIATDEQEAEYRRSGTVALQAIRPSDREGGGAAAPAREPPRRGRRRRFKTLAIVAVIVVLPLLIAGWLASRAVYFIGTDPRDDRTVAVFRGLPYDLPLGIHLYERYYTSGVALDAVPPARRATLTDHQLRSRDDAEDLVIKLEQGQVE